MKARTPRGEGTVPSAPKALVTSLQRSLSFGRAPKGKKSTPAAEVASAAKASTGIHDEHAAAGGANQAHLYDDLDVNEERPIEFDEGGVPLLSSLPEILVKLESSVPEHRSQGASHLAKLVDGSAGEQARILGGYLREAGAIELLVALLGDTEDTTVLLVPQNGQSFLVSPVLMALGNACSDSFDVASSETRLRLRGSGVLPQLLPLLEQGTDGTIQLYASALLLNMCKDMELALVALQLGATQQLDNICSQRGTSESLRHFASGALLNINTAVEVAESASTPRLWRGRANGRKASASNALDLSEAAHSAIVARQQKEERARQQRWRRANRAPRPTSAQTPRDAGPSGSPAPAPTTAPAAAPPPQGSPQGSPPPRGMPSPRVSPPLRSPQQRRAAGDAPPSSKDEEEALQMRIPFVQLAQVCAASQRSNDNDEEASEAPSSPKSTSSKTSWASYFTAKSTCSVSTTASHGSPDVFRRTTADEQV